MVGWRERFGADSDLALQRPATEEEVGAAGRALGVSLPKLLREMYLATDGLYSLPGQWFLVWQLTYLVERNLDDWSASWAVAERRNLIGFGDDGTGDPFCVRRDGNPGVFIWSPIEETVTRLAGSLDEFLDRWQANSLPRY